MNELKKCTKCGRELPSTMFNKKKSGKDGLQEHCKDCHKDYYLKSREKKNMAEKNTLHKVYAHPELSKYTPRQLMEELKARGFRWEYILEPQRKIMFEKI